MQHSMKVPQEMPETFNKPVGHSMPYEKNCRSQLVPEHPVQRSVENFEMHRHKLNMQMLREREGIAAPLKITMELKAVAKTGHLPFLPSSNVHRDVLMGNDEVIQFSDFLNTYEFSEFTRQPHAVVEKQLGI
ncbi:proteasome maturation protein [Culicoides brevitarsis]|uniref:proteasome maturation protein n=1 Tax=Culicoides brevitarsis TaxID=469753 RepID=UPI00307C44FB